MFSKEPAASRL